MGQYGMENFNYQDVFDDKTGVTLDDCVDFLHIAAQGKIYLSRGVIIQNRITEKSRIVLSTQRIISKTLTKGEIFVKIGFTVEEDSAQWEITGTLTTQTIDFKPILITTDLDVDFLYHAD